MKGENIALRFIDLAVDIIELTNKLSRNTAAKHIKNQLLRSGTSAGANYEEARAAESNADFIHKLKVVLKELRESLFWLNVIKKSKLIEGKNLDEVINEVNQLANIIASSIITTKKQKK